MPSKVQQVDGVLNLDGKEGVVLASTGGGLSFVAPAEGSYLVLDTKNLAILKAGPNSVAIYDHPLEGGMIDIQANKEGAVNLAVQDGATQNTALTVTDGKAHLGVFNIASFDRLHVEKGKITLESSVGSVAASTELGMVEVTPTKVTIKCMKSTMEVDVNGFTWENAAKTFKMALQTDKFLVSDTTEKNMFEIDLTKQTVSMKGMRLELDSAIQTTIENLENKINLNVAEIKREAITTTQLTDAIEQVKTTIRQETTQAITALKASLLSNN